ncbi:MAG: hypothetical protein A2107_13880 [Verrucomicrobia bacterium GWF2_62_7]|nr:MAG: hypothetical protein A2107_13880 [Verrucomicrobia bacterium GWF2_62_7]
MHDRYYPQRVRACKPGGEFLRAMSSEPSGTASLFWSCASFGFYSRVMDGRLGRSVGHLGLLGLVGALAVTLFFGTQLVPALRAAAKQTTGFVLNGGRLAVAPDSPTVLYDDGAHGMLLVRVAVDREPPPSERRYDAMLTLRPRGADLVIFGHTIRMPWPPGLAVDAQRLEMIAFMDSWWLLMCMAVYAVAFAWFFMTRLVHALIGAMLLAALASPTREVGFVRGFNLAAHATTPGTLLALGLLWLAAVYRLDPVLVNWSWLLYAMVTLVYLIGAATALPSKPANPWRGEAATKL